MKRTEAVGKFKVYFDRWRSYLGTAQFLIILIMFVLQTSISWWWIVGGFVLSLVWMWIDVRYIISAEYEAQQRKNWEMTSRMEKIDRIEEILKRMEGK